MRSFWAFRCDWVMNWIPFFELAHNPKGWKTWRTTLNGIDSWKEHTAFSILGRRMWLPVVRKMVKLYISNLIHRLSIVAYSLKWNTNSIVGVFMLQFKMMLKWISNETKSEEMENKIKTFASLCVLTFSPLLLNIRLKNRVANSFCNLLV